jgi:uncharacterized membrane protein
LTKIIMNEENSRKSPLGAKTRKIAVTGLLTAMTVVITAFTKIPTPLVHGYFNLGDTVVFIAGALFGGVTGAFVGAVGSAAADLWTGSFLFAPITLLVKGLEGFVAGRLAESGKQESGDGGKHGIKNERLFLALGAGAIVMAAGYFIAEATILGLFDRAFGLGAAIVELPINLIQGGISVLLARIVIEGLKRARIFIS